MAELGKAHPCAITWNASQRSTEDRRYKLFSHRNPATGINYFGNPRNMKNSITTGDRVTLNLEGNDVLVNNIVVISSGYYSGTVCGFEPNHLTGIANIKLGSKVEFKDFHVFSCSGAQ